MGLPQVNFKSNLNFITVHCKFLCWEFQLSPEILYDFLTLFVDLYFLSVIIIGSLIIYPMKNMAYIDALLFASGGATQSGLNPYVNLFIFCITDCRLIAFFSLPAWTSTRCRCINKL